MTCADRLRGKFGIRVLLPNLAQPCGTYMFWVAAISAVKNVRWPVVLDFCDCVTPPTFTGRVVPKQPDTPASPKLSGTHRATQFANAGSPGVHGVEEPVAWRWGRRKLAGLLDCLGANNARFGMATAHDKVVTDGRRTVFNVRVQYATRVLVRGESYGGHALPIGAEYCARRVRITARRHTLCTRLLSASCTPTLTICCGGLHWQRMSDPRSQPTE
jgi:hypothetical protein